MRRKEPWSRWGSRPPRSVRCLGQACDKWLQLRPRGGFSPQPTAVRTACPPGLLQARPARLPGPSPSPASPSVCTPASLPAWGQAGGEPARGPVWPVPAPAFSAARAGAEVRARERGGGRGAGQDWVCGLAWIDLGVCPPTAPDLRPLTCELGGWATQRF